jgi:DNA-binding NarL/FixJ family response regulator
MSSILIIEDDPNWLERLGRKIGEAFPTHTILKATNAAEGIRLAENPDVVAVVTDNHLPRSQEDNTQTTWAKNLCDTFRRRIPHLKNAPLCVFSNEISAPDRLALKNANVYIVHSKDYDEITPLILTIERGLAPQQPQID